MKTPLLDSISKEAALTTGFVDGYSEVKKQKIKAPKVEEPDIPKTIEKMHDARSSPATSPRGPQPTAMTANADNVVNYSSKGVR